MNAAATSVFEQAAIRAVLQSASHADDRRAVFTLGRAGDPRKAHIYVVSGGVACAGIGGTGTEHGRATYPGGAAAAVKTLEEFDFAQAPRISAAQIRDLAEGGYIERADRGLDWRMRNREDPSGDGVVRGRLSAETASPIHDGIGLVNELVEAKHQFSLRRVLARWARYELIAIDEVGYVPMADIGAEFLFQIIAERAEKAAVILTTNLPFSEWTQVFPNARLCKALLDRITDRAHIIDTGKESLSIPKEHGKAKTQRVKITAAPPRRRRENPDSREPEINNLEWAGRNDQSGPRGVVKSNGPQYGDEHLLLSMNRTSLNGFVSARPLPRCVAMVERFKDEVILARWVVDAALLHSFVRETRLRSKWYTYMPQDLLKECEKHATGAGLEVVVREDAVFVGEWVLPIGSTGSRCMRPGCISWEKRGITSRCR